MIADDDYYTAVVEKQLRVSDKTKHNRKYYIFGPIKHKNTIIRRLLRHPVPLRTVCGNSLPLERSPNIVAGTCSIRKFLDRYILYPVCWSDALGKTCKRRDTAISEFSSYQKWDKKMRFSRSSHTSEPSKFPGNRCKKCKGNI